MQDYSKTNWLSLKILLFFLLVLFIESNVDKRPMETVSKETGVPIYFPAIFSDELGKPGEEADTYLNYLKYNLKHIYKGLTGKSEAKK